MRRRLIFFAIIFLLVWPQALFAGEPQFASSPEGALETCLANVWIPAGVRQKIIFTVLKREELITPLGSRAVARFVAARNEKWQIVGGEILLASYHREIRTWEGFDIGAFCDYLSHEIGHAVWDIHLTASTQNSFRVITPKLHEQSLGRVSRQSYEWQTHREEFFSEAYRVLYCRICRLQLWTHWQFPVTQEIAEFFRTALGKPLRQPRPEETVP